MDSFNQKLERISSAKEAIKTSLTNKGMSPSDNIEDYAQIIDSIESGSGDVKLFETEEEMQADTTAKEGDLAVVYRSEVQNATVDSKFQVATFPETVVLDTAITGNVEVRYRAVDSSVMFDCMGSLDSSRFRMDCWSETGEVRIQYTSSDGITYTRTDTTGNPVDFGTEIHYEMPEYWNDAIGKFIQVSGSTFGGLFVGESIIKQIQPIKMSTMTINTETNVPIISDVITLNYNVDSFAEKIYPMVKHIDTLEGMTSHSRYPYCVYLKDNNTVSIIADGTTSDSVMLACPVFVDNTFKGLVAASYNVTNFYEWQFNLNTGEYIGRNNITATDYTTFGSSTFKYYYTTVFNDYYYVGNMDWTGSSFSYIYSLLYNNTSYSADTLSMTGVNGIMYFLAPTQLTAITEYVYGKEFYGKNGVEVGTLAQNVSNSFADINAEIVYKIQNQYENMEPRVLTDDDKTIDENMYFIPVKGDGTPLLNTSSVTNMNNMFQSCSKLTTIPLLDTSKVTNMSYMFYSCSKLTTIPLLDTSSVTTMYNMFSGCANLTTIPLLDTSKVTNMHYMFYGCANLTTIPLLDTSKVTGMSCMFQDCSKLTTIPLLNTSKVTNMSGMFERCTNLTTIPLLNTSKVTGMMDMFKDCTSLSDESLNNILAMCANATSYAKTKTLKYIGLTSEQATKCTTLSNYSAFTSAGWTTGY